MGKNSVLALLLAGGNGSRMQSDIPKQHLLLRGIPVAVRSALAFENASSVDAVIIVTRPEDTSLFREYCGQYHLSKVTDIVPGGATRQESAWMGLLAMPDRYRYLAIHDAARCLITPDDIDRVVSDAILYGAAAASVPATDTVKLTDRHGNTLTAGQPARDSLRLVQTPQVFLADLYRAAAYTARKDGFVATDDCALLEHCGKSCHMTDCSPRNLKITRPEDLLLAAALLEEET